jgi:biotin carboxyl carrier protein
MRFHIDVGGRTREVEVTPAGEGFAISVDRRRFHVDAARIDATTLSLVVDSVFSHEVVIVRGALNPAPHVTVRVGALDIAVGVNLRRRAGASGARAAAGSGPQRVIAPMPGKIVRLPVSAGDRVSAGQPVVVVEAMKMENELRASRDGTVADVPAREGASVEAGALLVVIQ